MRTDQVSLALEDAYRAAGAHTAAEPALTVCDIAAAVHAFLARAARESGWARAIVLRAAAGWVTDWTRERCAGP
jgi:hypothetical protein